MSRSQNILFFRGNYTLNEIESRLLAEHFREDSYGIVDEALDKTDISKDYLLENPPSTFLATLKRKLGDEYTPFLHKMFQQYGSRGDQANIRFFKSSELSKESLLQTLTSELQIEADGGEIDHADYYKLISDYSIYEGGIIDIEFSLTDDSGSIEISGGQFESRDGEIVDVEETEIERYQPPKDYTIEVRAYTNEDLIAISNSKGGPELQKAIFNSVRDWSDGSSSSENLSLYNNELLLLQNLMNGENSGLDYEEFNEKPLKTAKYRGKRTEPLTRSSVLTPAREQGKITQVRFYYTYNDGTRTREVQLRAYSDGHISTSTPILPSGVNKIVDNLLTVLKYQEYLDTLDEIIDTYVISKSRDELHFSERNYRRNKHSAFKGVVVEYIEDDILDETEYLVYVSVIANICTWLLQLDLSKEKYPNASGWHQRPKSERQLRQFLNDYVDYGPDEAMLDFDLLWSHLELILRDNRKGSPIDILDSAIKKYDF